MLQGMKVSEGGFATYNGVSLVTSKGEVKVKSLKEGQIS